MQKRFLIFFLILCSTYSKIQFTGINLSGAERGISSDGSIEGEAIFPSIQSINYFSSRGMNLFRIPFRWERLQPSLNDSFEQNYFSKLDSLISFISLDKKAYVILDLHNYARYGNSTLNIIGEPGSEVTVEDFENFWLQLASHYKLNGRIIFGIMNKPYGLSSIEWLKLAQSAINAIRRSGATQLILVPGTGLSIASFWNEPSNNPSNGESMIQINDPLNHIAFEVYQYLDEDSLGTSSSCVNATVGSQRLQGFTNWLKLNKVQGFLSEYAVGRNVLCYSALQDLLNYIHSNEEFWKGWAWWGAGSFPDNYIFSLDIGASGSEKPQLQYLLPHLAEFEQGSTFSPYSTEIPSTTTGSQSIQNNTSTQSPDKTKKVILNQTHITIICFGFILVSGCFLFTLLFICKCKGNGDKIVFFFLKTLLKLFF